MNEYYIKKGINKDKTILQYMDFDYLIRILETKCYYIKRKNQFEDKRESELSLKNLFPLSIVGDNCIKECVATTSEELTKKMQKYREYNQLLTSCWTQRSNENILMWKSYTSKFGVCIKSTVDNFVKSIQCEDYNLVCSYITYGKRKIPAIPEEELWIKETHYKDENEIRFYLFRDKESNNSNLHNKYNDGGIDIKINPQIMINEVIFTPFIETIVSKTLCKMFADKYSIPFMSSKIELKYH